MGNSGAEKEIGPTDDLGRLGYSISALPSPSPVSRYISIKSHVKCRLLTI